MQLAKQFAFILFLPFLVNQLLADDPVNDNKEQWWRGNLHTHTLWSDGNDFPDMVAKWYVDNDYNFLALTDHNVLSVGERWMALKSIEKRSGGGALDRYLKTFGNEWVETRGDREMGTMEVRLKALEEFRPKVESPGRFIMIQGEEISDSVNGAPLHLNATNLSEMLPPVGGSTIREAMRNNLKAANLQVKKTGKPMLVHLNHPNFGYAVTAEDLAAVTEEKFFEVYNGHPAVGHLGKKNYASVEKIWDIANTIRIGQLKSAPLFGIATDDSHEYFRPKGSRTGRGWVMVNSKTLSAASLIRSMEQGNFYSSSGVSLNSINFDQESQTLSLQIAAQKGIRYSTQFIGTPENYDQRSIIPRDNDGKKLRASRVYSSSVGKVLAEQTGPSPSYQLTGKELYVRAVVTASVAHNDPSFKDQKQQAWTQPVGWRKRVND